MGEDEGSRTGREGRSRERTVELPLRTRLARRRRQMLFGSLLGGVLLWVGAGFAIAARRPHALRLPSDAGAGISTHYDRELSRVVTRLAGRDAVVYCPSEEAWSVQAASVFGRRSAWGAFTERPALLTVDLSPQICAELLRLPTIRGQLSGRDDLDALAWSVGALAHEAVHASGIPDERIASCWGTQTIAATAMLLGRSAADGKILEQRFWQRAYRLLPRDYRSSECRDGGTLDRRPAVHAWP
jgi:hypothetical protein